MSRNAFIYFAFLNLFPAMAHAQQVVGNGGIVLAGGCYGPEITYEILDFYEAKIEYGFEIELGPDTGQIADKVNVALRRLARLDPVRAAKYQEWFASFAADSANLPAGVRLSSTDDYGSVDRRPDCSIRQAAVQRNPVVSAGKRYFFDAELVSKLDQDNHAGLVLHELIYRDAISRGQVTSRLARYLTALISSKDFETLSADDYARRLLETGMNEYRHKGQHAFAQLRYFPDTGHDPEQSREFCTSLPGFTSLTAAYCTSRITCRLEQEDWASIRKSPLGLFIGGTSGRETAVVWDVDGKKMQLSDIINTADNVLAMPVTGTLCVTR